jgi:hypothetical protein
MGETSGDETEFINRVRGWLIHLEILEIDRG